MKRSILLGYQLLTGVSDGTTGVLLIVAPQFTLTLMRLHPPTEALPFLSFVGAFVLSVGLACLYGALLVVSRASCERLQMVWLLTAFTRSCVAIFVLEQVLAGKLEAGWLTVAITDGVCVVIQAVGLRRKWLVDGAN